MEQQKSIIAVVELSNANEKQTRAHKIRIYNRSCTGKELCDRIATVLSEQGEQVDLETVEIFDNQQCEYISLTGTKVENETVFERFGCRIRCRVSQISASDPVLHIAGCFYRYDENEGLIIAGKRLKIKQTSNIAGGGTGFNIWDGAILLALYLEQQSDYIRGKRVLELGSGCGLVGIAAGLLGASDVLLTDLRYALPLMEENVQEHHADVTAAGCCRIKCVECDWIRPRSFASFTPGSAIEMPWQPDILLLADCVWLYELVEPLLNTIKKIASEATSPLKIIISYQRRGKEAHEAFLRGLYGLFDSLDEVDLSKFSLAKPETLSILECCK